jgi:hypothetical protein
LKRLSRAEFEARFPRRPAETVFDGLYQNLHVDRDAVISGLVQGSLTVDGGSHVLLTGGVEGSAHVGREAVLWVEGLVEGRAIIEGGAAFLNGTCSARGDRAAVVYDPSEPADSETGSP